MLVNLVSRQNLAESISKLLQVMSTESEAKYFSLRGQETPFDQQMKSALNDSDLTELARDVERVKSIMYINGFDISFETFSNPSGEDAVGVWINESMFNHSCVPNTHSSDIADFKFSWTARSVEAGEELTKMYTNEGVPFELRVLLFPYKWGFECACERCVFTR